MKDTICYILKNLEEDKSTYFLVTKFATLIHLKNKEYVLINSPVKSVGDSRVIEYDKDATYGSSVTYLKLKNENSDININKEIKRIADRELKAIKDLDYYDTMSYINKKLGEYLYR